MMTAFLVALLLSQGAAGAQASSAPLDRGIAAESAGRWEEALAVYLDDLRRDSHQSAMWLRVADIQARLGRRDECIAALTHAAAASPQTAPIYVRLSEAYAEAERPDAALAAIDTALVLAPDSSDYLRRHAVLATWAAKYDIAARSYRRLLRLAPDDADAVLGLARTSAWSGDTDRAVSTYRKYLRLRPAEREIWIELARAEAWRGNFAGSTDVLDEYQRRFGESPEHAREQIAVLAHGGRPRAATRLLDRAIGGSPDDYSLNVSRAVALAAQQRRGEALQAYDAVAGLRPGDRQTSSTRDLLRVALASTATPGGSLYGDSDGLRIWRFDPRLNVAAAGGTRIQAGYDRSELRARAGSGLERIGGTLDATHQLTWLGISQRAGALTVRGQAGYATIDALDRLSYAVSALFESDRVAISGARESAYFIASPRTVSLGLTRLTHRLGLDWAPSMRYHLGLDGAYDELSDGNRRWDVSFAPRRVFARTQRMNLDLGLELRQFGTTRNLDNGYYDPSRYESYLVTAFPYWKIGENTGIAGAIALGARREKGEGSFAFAQNAAVEATFGIYRNWMLKLNAADTFNDRLQSGAFRGYSGQVVLVRRF